MSDKCMVVVVVVVVVLFLHLEGHEGFGIKDHHS